MVSKKVVTIILILPVVRCFSIYDYEPSVQYIIDYMKNNFSTYQVTVTSVSAEELSLFSLKIVKSITEKLPSVWIDASVIEKIPAVRQLGSLWDRTIDQSSLKIAMVEIYFSEYAFETLKSALLFLMSYSENVRGKCIIFLINGDGQSLEPFLRFAWSHDFLDLTVVEWAITFPTLAENGTATFPTLTSTENEIPPYDVFIHFFNPFQDKYTKDRLSNTTDIFPNKARNLHGYNFHADPRVSLELDGPINPEKSEVQTPISYLIDTLNFTLTYGILKKYENNEFHPIDLYRQNASRGRPIDFFLHMVNLNPEFNPSVKPLDASAYMNEISYSMLFLVDAATPFEYHFIVLQERIPEIRISLNFLITFITLSGMGLIFLLSSRVMGFDKKIWSTVRIARALMGGTLENRRQMKLAEKILLVTLYFVSIVMMTFTSDELIKMSVSRRDVFRLTTLEELADSRMGLYMDKRTFKAISWYGLNYPKLQKIANRSNTVIVSMDEILNVTFSRAPLNSIYLVLREIRTGFPHVIKTGPTLYQTHLKDVVATGMNFMVVRSNFPLKKRFGEFFLKLSESGLLMHDQMLELFRFYSERYAWGQIQEMHNHFRPDMDQEEELSLTQRLLIIILSGYALACIALIWEIFSKSQFPVKIAESNSKRERFVRCLVEEAKSKIEKESSREFDSTQSQLRILTLGQLDPSNLPKLSVESERRKENYDRKRMIKQNGPRVFGLLELDNAHLIDHLKRKRRTSIPLISHDEQSMNHR
ncbi:hypothetical protein QAD02_010921 [Eretmocerus hayati]|uniref:Uncharacterized protein n=1 Tax=Eretmocerus hayati TaxID=131215 RepID=A0ACC2P022_9HYME|nr:hypothetical protein QAD02_010921 [Eretmocerus hayati]